MMLTNKTQLQLLKTINQLLLPKLSQLTLEELDITEDRENSNCELNVMSTFYILCKFYLPE
jgi:hypothetical protein